MSERSAQPSPFSPQARHDRLRAPMVVDVPAVASSCAVLRAALRDWITGLGCSQDVGDDVVVAANEALCTVIEHADRGPRSRHIHVSAAQIRDREGCLRIAVILTHFGRWRLTEVEPVRDRYDFDIMRACMDHVDVGTDGSGTRLTLISAPIAPAGHSPHTPPRPAPAAADVHGPVRSTGHAGVAAHPHISHAGQSARSHADTLQQRVTLARQRAAVLCARSAAAREAARTLWTSRHRSIVCDGRPRRRDAW